MADSFGVPSRYDEMNPRQIASQEEQLYAGAMREFNLFVQYRNMGFAPQWEEVADLVLPTSMNTFFYGAYNTPGEKKTQSQVDSTGMMALHRFAAICDSLLTPRNMLWHTLTPDMDYVMKDKKSREWYEIITRTLFNERYIPNANFSAQNQANFQGLGAFGNGAMFIDSYRDHKGVALGLRYRGCPLGELFWGENHQGVVDRVMRWFKLTAWQAEQKWPGMLPPVLQQALNASSPALYDFIHVVRPREDHDPGAPDERSLAFTSFYLCVSGQCLIWDKGRGEGMEQGYNSMPFAPMRYDQAPNESYGRGPAMMVLPALKTLNAQKRTFLKQGHRAADPVLLSFDDGLMNFSMRPGAINKGGMNQDGKPLVGILPTGDIATNEKMMDMEKALINSAFLVDLFQILTETPQMTATEVIERTHEKGILIAPTLGRIQAEHHGPLIDRELDILVQQRKIPPMPPRVQEARGGYKVVYQSPLAKAQHAQEVSGTLRVVENIREIVAVTGDSSPLDRFNFDNFTEDAAIISGTRERWLCTDEELQAKRQNRAAAQQQQQALESLPGKAAIMNAQAKIAKSNGAFPQQGEGAVSPPGRGGQ